MGHHYGDQKLTDIWMDFTFAIKMLSLKSITTGNFYIELFPGHLQPGVD